MLGAWFFFLLAIIEASAEMEEPFNIAQVQDFALDQWDFTFFPA